MELNNCIRGRRSIRAYEAEKVPKDTIEKIIEAGVWAPSGMNSQPWKFIVIEDQTMIKRLSDRTKDILLTQPWPDEMKKAFKSEEYSIFYNAPLLILICVEKKENWESVHNLDCALAAENMFLTAYQEGLGSCFIGFGNFLNQDKKLLAEVGVPEGHDLIAPLIFGKAAEEPEPKPRDKKILNWIR